MQATSANGKASEALKAELAAEIMARAFLHCERLGVTVKLSEGCKGTKVIAFHLLAFEAKKKSDVE